MRSYKPDEELIKILIANGYKEVKPLQPTLNGSGMNGKREFAIYNKNVTSQTPHIQLNHGAVKENRFQFYEPAIEEPDLKALICFHKLTGSMANTLRNKFRYAWHLQSISNFFTELEKEDSDISRQISKPLRKRILQSYNEVIL